MQKCLKQSVIADLVFSSGITYSGNNDIDNNLIECCPRDEAGFKSGFGYELCKDICGQTSHAEISVINQYKKSILNDNGYSKKYPEYFDLETAIFTVKNHNYICDNCLMAIIDVGIKNIEIINAYSKKVYTIKDNKLNLESEVPTYLLKVGDLVYFEHNNLDNIKNKMTNRLVGKINKFYYMSAFNKNERISVDVMYDHYEDGVIMNYVGDIENLKKVKG